MAAECAHPHAALPLESTIAGAPQQYSHEIFKAIEVYLWSCSPLNETWLSREASLSSEPTGSSNETPSSEPYIGGTPFGIIVFTISSSESWPPGPVEAVPLVFLGAAARAEPIEKIMYWLSAITATVAMTNAYITAAALIFTAFFSCSLISQSPSWFLSCFSWLNKWRMQ